MVAVAFSPSNSSFIHVTSESFIKAYVLTEDCTTFAYGPAYFTHADECALNYSVWASYNMCFAMVSLYLCAIKTYNQYLDYSTLVDSNCISDINTQ